MKTKNKLCPVGTEVQTVIFDKSNFNESSAKKWAKSNDLKYGYVDEKDKTYRIRQQEPDYFVNGSLRTIEFTKGVKAVIGCPKPKYRKFEDGGEADDMLTGTWSGSFENSYEGKNPLEVWNNWTKEQKRHFLYDHYQEIVFREKNYYESGKIKEKVIAKEGINEYVNISSYNSLPLVIREAVLDHTIMGQYSTGGEIDVNDGCIQETIRLIDEDKKIHDWFIDGHNKKLVIIFDNELKLNEVDRINSLLKDFFICHDIIDTEVLPVFDSEYRMITLNLKTDKFEIMSSFGAGGVVDGFQPKTQIVLETPPMFSSFSMGASQADFPAMVNKAGYMFVDISNHTKTSYTISIQIEQSRFKINDKVEGLKYLEKQEYSWFNSTTYMAYYIKTKSLLEIQYHIEKNIEKLMPSIKLDGLVLKVYKSNAVNQILSTTPELQLEKATASKSGQPEMPEAKMPESKPETSETKKSDQPETENPTDNSSEIEALVKEYIEKAKKEEKQGKLFNIYKKKDGSSVVITGKISEALYSEDEWFLIYSSEIDDNFIPAYKIQNYLKELLKYSKGVGSWIGSYKKPIKTSDVSEFLNSTKNDGHKYSLWNKEVGVTYAYNGKLYANDGQVLPKGTVMDLDKVMNYWKTKNTDTLLVEDEELVVLPEKQDKYNCYTTGYEGRKNSYGNEDNITLKEAVEFCWYYDDVRRKYATKEDLEKEINSTPYGKENVIASGLTGVVVYKLSTQQYSKGGGVGDVKLEDIYKIGDNVDVSFSLGKSDWVYDDINKAKELLNKQRELGFESIITENKEGERIKYTILSRGKQRNYEKRIFSSGGGVGFSAGGRIKDEDIQIGKQFKLMNGEIIEIKRLFVENIDEDWVEYTRNGTTQESSVKSLRQFINNWREKVYADGGIVNALTKEYNINDYYLEDSKRWLTDYQIDRWRKQGHSQEQIERDIQRAKKEIKNVEEKTPYLTWYLEIPKGKYEFKIGDATYKIVYEKESVEDLGWKRKNWKKNIYSVVKTNQEFSPLDEYLSKYNRFETKDNLQRVLNNYFKESIQSDINPMYLPKKEKMANGGEINDYSISSIISKTDFDEQTKKSMIDDFTNAGFENVYALKTQENLSDEFKIEQTADNIMNSFDWNYSMSDANKIAEVIHSVSEPEPKTETEEVTEVKEEVKQESKSEQEVHDTEYSLQILEYLNKLLGKNLDKSFLIGKKVELIEMKGESQMAKGTTGVIEKIDGIGQFHINWDNGSSLALIPNEDKFKVFFAGGEILLGGKGDKLTLKQIAEKHNVPLAMIKKQFLLGIKFESEHTSDKKMQEEIVKDHLTEFPNYYTALQGMETYLERMKEGSSASALFIDLDKSVDMMAFLVPLSIKRIKYLEVPSEFPDKRRIEFYSDKDFDKAVIIYRKSKLKNQVSA